MMATTDIGNALYKDCMAFGIPVYQAPCLPKGEMKEERIIIHVKPQEMDKVFCSCFAEVNLAVPDRRGEADLVRLNKLERMARGFFCYAGEHDGTAYDVSLHSIGIMRDEQLKCHYVNARVLIRVLNIN